MSEDVLANEQATPRVARQVAEKMVRDSGWTPPERPDPDTDWKLNPAKEGLDYDDCPRPSCGTRDVEVDLRVGQKAQRFCCPDCGVSWFRENQREGLSPYASPRRTASAGSGRIYSMPSQRYRDNYDLIDWSK